MDDEKREEALQIIKDLRDDFLRARTILVEIVDAHERTCAPIPDGQSRLQGGQDLGIAIDKARRLLGLQDMNNLPQPGVEGKFGGDGGPGGS